jgi:signal transduction histidine kinase
LNADRLRLRLTLGYVGIFTLAFLFLGAAAALGAFRELVHQQDDLLTQEAQNQARNLLDDEHREVLAAGSAEFGWIALKPDGRIIDRDPAARSLGLPSSELAREALRENGPVFDTIRGRDGMVRAVSRPMYDDSGELVGVVQYARSLQGVWDTLNGLLVVLLPLGLGALGLAAIGGTYMASKAVQPVRESFERQRAFIADASHELKTPLTLIRADTEVLQRGLDDPDHRELTDDVLFEADRMSFMISDLLLVARLDAGKLTVGEKSFDLRAVISEATDRFEKQAVSEGLRLEVRAENELPVRGDPGRTEQVLAKLLENALAHTPRGGVVTVFARARDGFVETAIEDTGPGIPPEHLPRVFERFYRVDAARGCADGGGTGLGLSIAQDLARAQGGDLTAANGKHGGAVFRLKLPRG